MKKFKFQLEALLGLRREQRDMRRQMLAEVLRRADALRVERERIERERKTQIDELRVLGAPGELDVDASASRRYFASQLAGDKSQVEREQALVFRQIEACRQALIRADQAVKALEKLSEKRFEEFRFAQERRESLELEDAWRALRAQEAAPC